MADAAFLPYGRQSIGEDDIEAVAEVLRGERLTTGPAVADFEAAFAAETGAAHAVSCANGTAALHLAAMALGLGPGDVAVVPAVTFLATANAVRLTGAEVAFCDVDPDTALMRPEDLEAALAALEPDRRARVRAAIPVHIAGQPAPMAALAEIAKARGIALVEDACHAVGTGYDGDGRIGDCRHATMAAFSFHPVKTVTAAEGGMVTTNDEALARALAALRNHGMSRDPERFTERAQAFDGEGRPNPWYYEMAVPGLNYRLSDLHAALGRSQLAKLDRFARRRAALVARYDERLAALAPVVRPAGRVSGARPCWHLYVALLDFAAIGRDRAAVMRALAERGIGTQVHYLPVHRQPYYAARCGAQALPGADAWYARALSLPLFPDMADADVDRVAAALGEIVGGRA